MEATETETFTELAASCQLDYANLLQQVVKGSRPANEKILACLTLAGRSVAEFEADVKLYTSRLHCFDAQRAAQAEQQRLQAELPKAKRRFDKSLQEYREKRATLQQQLRQLQAEFDQAKALWQEATRNPLEAVQGQHFRLVETIHDRLGEQLTELQRAANAKCSEARGQLNFVAEYTRQQQQAQSLVGEIDKLLAGNPPAEQAEQLHRRRERALQQVEQYDPAVLQANAERFEEEALELDAQRERLAGARLHPAACLWMDDYSPLLAELETWPSN